MEFSLQKMADESGKIDAEVDDSEQAHSSSAKKKKQTNKRKQKSSSDDDSSASESDESEKKTQKKAKSKKQDKEENDSWELGNKRQISLSEFRGKVLVDIREWYEKDGKKLPGKKGISLTSDQWHKLVKVAPAVSAKLDQM